MNRIDEKYQALLTPWKIGNVEIKNRIVMCPMGGTSLFGWFELTGCHFDKEAAKLFLERANNNVGLIIPGIAPLRDTFWGKWLWQNEKMFKELKINWMNRVEKLKVFNKELNNKLDQRDLDRQRGRENIPLKVAECIFFLSAHRTFFR